MTTYDTIWEAFLTESETLNINLPTETERIKNTIHAAIKKYNVFMDTPLEKNATNEIVNVEGSTEELTDGELELLVLLLKYIFIQNKISLFITTYQPFAYDIGIKNFQVQLNTLKTQQSLIQEEIDQAHENLREYITSEEEY